MEIIFLLGIILDISRSVSGQNSLKLNLNLDLVLENLKIMLKPAITKFQLLDNWKVYMVDSECLEDCLRIDWCCWCWCWCCWC